MKSCDQFEAVEAYLDGEGAEGAAALEAHIARCPACSAYAEDIRLLSSAIRQAGHRQCAPEHLARRLEDIGSTVVPADRPVARRQALALGAVAAGAAVAATALGWRLGRDGGMDMAPDLFGDFATQLAANRPLDLAESDPQRVAAWFAPKLPFMLPDMPALATMSLRGGRLCWLLERRIAALDLLHEGGAICLYLSFAEGLTVVDGLPLPAASEAPALQAGNGVSGAFWREGELAHGLVGAVRLQTMVNIAERLRA